ncbi:hypothetical protein [Kitasatospora sp. A2-31]|uniref:hypothetical protein n=1 Tax=Kitasatospora sp. A2-31 TaxID=2916414 RepID=UPI001EE7B816|nr:hypothetical protein [Kitasatospora sp. A2-31]MCG6493400.1 hypothetical protein [Kitasatospora sp. A2-31]
MTAYQHRLRLHGGRNTHAARAVASRFEPTYLVTPCGHTSGRRDELKPDDTPITCPTCTRRIAAEETAR